MATLSSISWMHFKSPLNVVVQFLLRSRDCKTRKCNELKRKLLLAQRQRTQAEKIIIRQQLKIRELEEQVRQLRTQTQSTVRLPDDPPIGTHGYGARTVCLAVNLAKTVGLRGTERVLKIFFDWLEVDRNVPHWTAIRLWLQRLGVARAEEPITPADDWIWMVDHSNQIGPEKVLVVLGIQARNLPPPGTALKHEDVHVLMVRPGTDWKRDDMALVYNELAERYGPPRALLMDGAAELREGAKTLQNKRCDMLVLSDFKHKAANLFKAIFGSDERFEDFLARAGRTRSAIQQTELAHLSPPSIKQKARFMNMQTRLRWATTMLWLLEHPEAESRQWMTTERLEEKLGWLHSFADDIALWRECEEVIEQGVKCINEYGLFHGASDRLRSLLGSNLHHPTSRNLADRLIEFVAAAEAGLKEGERLPMSTEILESSFSLYKQLERQHSKGGFTSLLASFGSLLKRDTPATIRRLLRKVSVHDVRAWVKRNLGVTLSSRRRATYQEYRSAATSATKAKEAT